MFFPFTEQITSDFRPLLLRRYSILYWVCFKDIPLVVFRNCLPLCLQKFDNSLSLSIFSISWSNRRPLTPAWSTWLHWTLCPPWRSFYDRTQDRQHLAKIMLPCVVAAPASILVGPKYLKKLLPKKQRGRPRSTANLAAMAFNTVRMTVICASVSDVDRMPCDFQTWAVWTVKSVFHQGWTFLIEFI